MPSRVGGQRAPGRIPALDGVRALAVLAVVVFHLRPRTMPGGFVGVDVFFVLSGLLITRGLLRDHPQGVRALGEFWLRRARRILPALLVLVAVAGAAARVVGGDASAHLGRQAVGAVTLSSNWVLLLRDDGYFAATSPPLLKNLWSLAVEEQFYLLWPLLFALLARRCSRRTLIRVVAGLAASSALAMAVLVVPAGVDRVYYGTDTHGFGLLAGAAVAVVLHGTRAGAPPWSTRGAQAVAGSGLVALAAATLLLDGTRTSTYVVGLPLVALVAALTLAALALSDGPVGALLASTPLRVVGARSYGLYLWHWPVMVLVRGAGADRHAVPFVLLVLALTAAAAEASYRWVERPVLEHGFRAALGLSYGPSWRGGRARRVAVVAVAGSLCAAAVSPLALANRGVPSGEQLVRAGIASVRDPAEIAAPTSPPPTAEPSPGAPDPGAAASGADAPADPASPTGPEITAVGDSVMLASAPALQERLPGIQIDAKVGRQASAAADVLRDLASRGELRGTVVLGVGTNGYLGPGTLASIREAIGPDRMLVLVTVFADRVWQDAVNQDLADFAAADPHAVLVDWHGIIAQHPDELASDGIHPGPSAGRRYADGLVAALGAGV